MRDCAKWCGRGCTREEHDLATKQADLLAACLGDGWKPHVWENMGWHYEVVHKRVGAKMSRLSSDYFTIFVDSHNEQVAVERGTTPQGAIKSALDVIRKKRDALDATLKALGG